MLLIEFGEKQFVVITA